MILKQNLNITLRPGFNPIDNIFSSENFLVKNQKKLKTQFLSVKTEKKLCRFLVQLSGVCLVLA